jgi:uncharacterized protein YciI
MEGFHAVHHSIVLTRTVPSADPAGEPTVETYSPPDHYARLAACNAFLKFITAGRPKPRQPKARQQEKRMFTIQEIREAIARDGTA